MRKGFLFEKMPMDYKGYSEMLTSQFDKLPNKCKEMFFEYCLRKDKVADFLKFSQFYCTECCSPIEMIFKFAYDILQFENPSCFDGIDCWCQYEIETENKKYISDFLLFPYALFENNIEMIIECDGHEFHSTKQQIEKDNKRDMDLKKAGYEVVHFSGSQIFKEPFKCVMDAVNLYRAKLGKEVKDYGGC